MSPADRWRAAGKLARVLIERLREGLTLTAREVEEAAADLLEAGLAEPAPVAGGSAEERARLREKEKLDRISGRTVVVISADGEIICNGLDGNMEHIAASSPPVVLSLLAALDAAEARAATAEAHLARQNEKLHARWQLIDDMNREKHEALARAAQAERERDQAINEADTYKVAHIDALKRIDAMAVALVARTSGCGRG